MPRFTLFGSIFLTIAGASAQGASAEPLTLSRVIEVAVERSPAVLIAETRVREARGILAGARALGMDNPSVEAVRGSGENLDQATELELQIPLGFGFQRRQRVAEARAGVEREEHVVNDARRQTVGLALAAFYGVLHAEERTEIARGRRDLADELRRVTAEKVRAGDAARLDLVVAEGELSRAEGEVSGAQRAETRARVELASVLGDSSGVAIEVSGDLADLTGLQAVFPSSSPERRPDILAAESEVAAAEAALSLGRAARIPAFALLVNYHHSRADDIVRPGVSVSLPIFNHGQGARGEARARRERARLELEARRTVALAEAEGARIAYESAALAIRESEERGLPRAVETESLARHAYEAGKLDLPALLVVRANALEAKRAHADRQLEAALAAIDLAVSTGALPTR